MAANHGHVSKLWAGSHRGFGRQVWRDFVKMNYDAWRLTSLGPRWQWENAESLQLCLMDRYAETLKADLVKSVDSMVTEFKLPLEIKIASSHTLDLIERLLTKCSFDSAISCWGALEELNRKRHDEPSLRTGLVIAFDGIQRGLRDETSHKPEEPPEWGWTADDGLILLRLIRGQPLKNLVRHEMGHLLGIGQHHLECVMTWACTEQEFCAQCKKTILETCQIADTR